MSDGLAKGIGEQLGDLGKQIITEVAKTPGKIIGIDETKGQGTGSSSVKGGQKPQGKLSKTGNLARQDEIDTQQKLAQARKLLQQISQPSSQEQPVYDKNQIEAVEKQQKLLKQQQTAARGELPKIATRPSPWSILKSTKQQSGSETKANVKAQ